MHIQFKHRVHFNYTRLLKQSFTLFMDKVLLENYQCTLYKSESAMK